MQHLLAAEGQQLPDERGSAIGGFADMVKRGSQSFILLRFLLHQLAVAFDDGQQIIEVVSDAAGQGADGFHLLLLTKLLLHLAHFGDVLHRRQDARLALDFHQLR